MKYTLIVDLGNTNVKFNIFNGQKLVCSTFVQIHDKEFIIASVKLLDLLRSNSIKKSEIKDGMIFSVVPSLNRRVKHIIRHVLRINLPVFKNSQIDFSMPGIPDMNEIGADILGDIIGALETYKPPLMIVDLGTITKSIFINEKKELIGVSFMPGLEISLNLMNTRAALLPTTHVRKPETWYGCNTIDAMNTGAYYSNVCAIRHYRTMMEKDHKGLTFVLAGGHAKLINKHIKPDFVETDLAAIGMNYIYRKYLKK